MYNAGLIRKDNVDWKQQFWWLDNTNEEDFVKKQFVKEKRETKWPSRFYHKK